MRPSSPAPTRSRCSRRQTTTTISVFVRDRGVGFDRGAVPADRRGLSESIEGRMERAGGTANVDAVPGEGIEVELTLAAEAVVKRRVVLVDDHELFRAGVRGELGDAVDVVGEAGTSRKRCR